MTQRAGVPPSKKARSPDSLGIDGLVPGKIILSLVMLDQVFELC